MIRQYRNEMEEKVSCYLSEHSRAFESCFRTIDDAILQNDVDGFIRGNHEIQRILGKEPRFKSFDEFDEFDEFMKSDKPLVF